MNPSRIERIKELFLKLKVGYDWCHKNESYEKRQFELFDRSKPIFDELEQLGVSRSFSSTLFFFGPAITDELVQQFKEEAKKA